MRLLDDHGLRGMTSQPPTLEELFLREYAGDLAADGPRAAGRPGHVRPGGAAPMSELTGTWQLVRFTVRRDRLRIVTWVVSLTALVIATAASIKGLFPTQADLDQAAAASAKNAAAIAFNGPVQGLDTVGGEVAFQAGTVGLVLVALMSLLMTGRYTRVEEESGRTELVRATVVGRDAQTAAALLVVTGMNLLIGAAVAVGLIGTGLPVVGSVSFGASFLAIGLVFTALALVTAQVSENSRAASGLAGVVLGYAFAVRAVGDIGDGRLSWLSPIGWSQKLRPYAGERWWPLLVPVAVTVLLLMTARALSARRDWGAGLVQPRPGPAIAAPRLGRPLGLAVRLQRATLLAWTVALAVFGFVYGAIADDIGDFVGDSQTLKDLLAAPAVGPVSSTPTSARPCSSWLSSGRASGCSASSGCAARRPHCIPRPCW